MIDSSFVHLEGLTDSINQVVPLIRDIRDNSAPAPFTYINIVISLIAAIFGFGSFFFAKKTADNVSRLSKKTQIDLCEDLIRDFLQNVVRLLVVFKRSADNDWDIEAFSMDEIRYWPADIYFKQDIFNTNSKIYKKIYRQKQRMDDYNQNLIIYNNALKEKKIGEKEILKLYASNWKNIEKAYDIFITIKKKHHETIYDSLFKDYKDKLENKCIYEDKDLTQKYKVLFDKINNIHKENKESWEPIECELKESFCSGASLFEIDMRIKEKRNSGK